MTGVHDYPMLMRSVVIDSDLEQAHRIQSEVIAATQAFYVSETDQFGICLALEEALVNAIKHGNGTDSARKVRVDVEFTSNRVYIRIEDEGPGFDAAAVPDPTLPENLNRPSGRGLLLMRYYMSRVEFHGRGNVVEMEKRVTASGNGSNGTLGQRGDRVQLGRESGAPNPSSLNHCGKVQSEIHNGHSTGVLGALINATLRVTGST